MNKARWIRQRKLESLHLSLDGHSGRTYLDILIIHPWCAPSYIEMLTIPPPQKKNIDAKTKQINLRITFSSVLWLLAHVFARIIPTSMSFYNVYKPPTCHAESNHGKPRDEGNNDPGKKYYPPNLCVSWSPNLDRYMGRYAARTYVLAPVTPILSVWQIKLVKKKSYLLTKIRPAISSPSLKQYGQYPRNGIWSS